MERTFLDWIIFIVQNYGLWFLRGAAVTLLIALISTIVGFVIGLLIGAVRTIPLETHHGKGIKYYLLRLVNIILICYIEVFRGTPMMVQSIVIYFGMQEGLGIDFAPMAAGLLIVSLNTGAYMAEVVRGGIQSIDPGQTEAAKALGMTHWQTMVNVIFPQTIRNILPATGNEFVINIKDTSVLNVISVSELFFMTKTVKGIAFRTYETFVVAGLIYLLMTVTVTQLLKLIERRMDGPSSFRLSDRKAEQRRGGV